MKKIFSTLIILFVAITSIYSQDIQQELNRINKFYHSKPLCIELNYKSYINYTAINPLSEAKGKFVINGNNTFQELDNILTLNDSIYTIQVNQETNTVVVNNRNPDAPADFLPFNMAAFLIENTKIRQLKYGMRQLTVSLEGTNLGYDKIVITYDTTNYFIKKATLYFEEPMQLRDNDNLPEEKPRLEIIYTINNEENAGNYLKNNFFIKSGNDLQLSDKYKEYELVDNRSIRPPKNKKS